MLLNKCLDCVSSIHQKLDPTVAIAKSAAVLSKIIKLNKFEIHWHNKIDGSYPPTTFWLNDIQSKQFVETSGEI